MHHKNNAGSHLNHYRGYSDKHDAMFCKTCNVWLEGRCNDPNCEFCLNRPEIPFSEKNEDRSSEKQGSEKNAD
jgi:hypothetical protein